MLKREEDKPIDMNYFSMLGIDENDMPKEHSKLFEAWKFANEVRIFEIENFWKRAAYYWAYITGSVVVYSFVLNKSFCDNSRITFESLCKLPFFNKLVLCVIAFLIFLFSLAWVLVNKGSKYWQNNWEAHVAELENDIVGKIYKTHLQEKVNTDSSFLRHLKMKSYRYSVSKITILCSIVVMFLSLLLFGFHVTLIFMVTKPCFCNDSLKFILAIVVSTVFIIVILVFVCKYAYIKGKTDSKIVKTERYFWFQDNTIV